MLVINNKRGAGIVDAIVTLFLLGVVGAIFTAVFPVSISCSRQAQEYKTATTIAQRKMEQLRAINYESITQPLMAGRIIDSDSTTSPYSFTSIDSIADQLPSGTGKIDVDEVGDIKYITVTVRWQGPSTPSTRNVQLTTLIVDRRTRQVN